MTGFRLLHVDDRNEKSRVCILPVNAIHSHYWLGLSFWIQKVPTQLTHPRSFESANSFWRFVRFNRDSFGLVIV